MKDKWHGMPVVTITLSETEHDVVLDSLLKSASYYLNRAERAEAEGKLREAFRWKEKREDTEAVRQRLLLLEPSEADAVEGGENE